MSFVKLQDIKALRPFMAITALLTVSVASAFFLNSAYYAEKKESLIFFIHSTALSADLRLNEVYIRGREKTGEKEILEALKIEQGMPITAVDLPKAREALQHLPWIKTVHIERRLPHILYIRITERTPIAVWQNKGQYRPVDSDGQPVEIFVKKLNGLLLVVGTDAPEKTPDLLTFLAQEPELKHRVKAAVRKGLRRWDIILDDIDKGITVRLPEQDPASAWGRLANLDRTEKLLSRKITLVDLRQPDKLVVRLEEDVKKGKNQKASPSSSEKPANPE